jgi:hypothetical protein
MDLKVFERSFGSFAERNGGKNPRLVDLRLQKNIKIPNTNKL